MRGSANIRQKNQASVCVTLNGQEPFDGVVFLTLGDRLIDLLNDDRCFIPIRKTDDSVVIVAKSQIVSIVEADAEDPEEILEEEAEANAPAKRKFDPYAALRVEPDASIDEIRTAYKTRIKAVHPDSIAALGLDEDLAAAALRSTQKINYAYGKIMRAREEAAQEEAAREDTTETEADDAGAADNDIDEDMRAAS